MMQQGIGSFIAKQPQAFSRRARRGIPMEFRWEVWKAAIRVGDKSVPGIYRRLVDTDNQWTRQIELDVPRTFPEMPSFGTEYQDGLTRVLHAYANFNPHVGYCQGMNFVAGLLLLVAHGGELIGPLSSEMEEDIFWTFVCLMEEGGLSGFYRLDFLLLRRYMWGFDQLLADTLPELRDHFVKESIEHEAYLHQWFLTLFVNSLPLPIVLLFWDSVICGGDAGVTHGLCSGPEALLPITVSLLRLWEADLLSLRFEGILKFFKTMRSNVEDCSATRGRAVVSQSSSIDVPAHVIARLRAPLPPPSEDDSILPFDFLEECETPSGKPLRSYLRQARNVWNWWEGTLDNLDDLAFMATDRLIQRSIAWQSAHKVAS